MNLKGLFYFVKFVSELKKYLGLWFRNGFRSTRSVGFVFLLFISRFLSLHLIGLIFNKHLWITLKILQFTYQSFGCTDRSQLEIAFDSCVFSKWKTRYPQCACAGHLTYAFLAFRCVNDLKSTSQFEATLCQSTTSNTLTPNRTNSTG